MGFGSFSSNDENTSFEQGISLNQTAKNAVKTTTTQTKKVADDTRKAILDQLYGPSTSSADSAAQQAGDAGSQASQTDHQQSPSQENAQAPGEQGKLDETRRKLQELQRLHKQNYYDKYLGDDAQRKLRQEEQQKKQQEAQAEDQERQQLEAEKAQMDEGTLLPAGKKAGAMFGKKQQQPIALTRAKTKTEMNRGASG